MIYRSENGDKAFITGDEFDWEPSVPLLWNNANFTFSAYERDQVAKILWPTIVETIETAGDLERLAKPGETPESVMGRYELAQQQERQHVYGIKP